MGSAAAIRRTCVGIGAGPILKIIIDPPPYFQRGDFAHNPIEISGMPQLIVIWT